MELVRHKDVTLRDDQAALILSYVEGTGFDVSIVSPAGSAGMPEAYRESAYYILRGLAAVLQEDVEELAQIGAEASVEDMRSTPYQGNA